MILIINTTTIDRNKHVSIYEKKKKKERNILKLQSLL